MEKLNLNTMAGYVVKTDGEIDVERTIDKFRSELINYKTERELEAETVGQAVNSVFDKFKGANLNVQALKSYTLQVLNFQPENFKSLNKKVEEYVKANTGKREEGALFQIVRAKGGGIRRWSDQLEYSVET